MLQEYTLNENLSGCAVTTNDSYRKNVIYGSGMIATPNGNVSNENESSSWSGEGTIYSVIKEDAFRFHATYKTDGNFGTLTSIVLTLYDATEDFYFDEVDGWVGTVLQTYTTSYSEGSLFAYEMDVTPNTPYFASIKAVSTEYSLWIAWSNPLYCVRNIATPSSISYSQSLNRLSYSANGDRKYINFSRDSSYNPTGYSEETRKWFYTAACRLEESGDNNKDGRKRYVRWGVGTHKVNIRFNSSVSSEFHSYYQAFVTSWVSSVNSALSGSGVTFTYGYDTTDGEMTITFGYQNDWGWSSTQNGYASVSWDNDAYINTSTVLVAVNPHWRANVKGVVYEELTQALGLLNDTNEISPEFVAMDFPYPNKNQYGLTSLDVDILQLHYKASIPVGLWSHEVAEFINAPNGGVEGSSSNVNFNFLKASTTYNVSVYTINNSWNLLSTNSGYSYASGLTSYTTPSYDPVPSAPTGQSPARIDGGLKIQWNSINNTDFYTIRRRNYTGINYYIDTSSYNMYTATGLEYGVTYYWAICASNNYPDRNVFGAEAALTTAPKLCNVNRSNVTANSVDLAFNGFSGNWTKVKVEWSLDTSYSNSWDVNNPDVATTITNLIENRTYNFRVSVIFNVNSIDIYSVDSNGNTSYQYFIVSTVANRPSDFNWTTTITSGGNIYEVSGKNLYVVSAVEWNAFTAKINQFRTYKSLSTVNFTGVNRGTNFTASVFNQARTAINDMSPPVSVPPSVSAGNYIDAYYLLRIRDALNSIV